MKGTYNQPAKSRAQRKLEQKARAFRHDEQMEYLAKLLKENPAELDRIATPETRMGLAYYLERKAAAEELGLL